MSEILIEGTVKVRYDTKWKRRYGVVTKPSPVADGLSLLLFRDQVERCSKQQRLKGQTSIDFFACLTLTEVLERAAADFLSRQSSESATTANKYTSISELADGDVDGANIKGERHVLALVTAKRILLLLAFEDVKELSFWTERLQKSMLCSTLLRFAVEISDYESTFASSENAAPVHSSSLRRRLSRSHAYLRRGLLCITQCCIFFISVPFRSAGAEYDPPKLERFWEITEIKAFGIVRPDLFAVEGGSRCESGSGCHFFRSSPAAILQISRQAIAAGSGRFPDSDNDSDSVSGEFADPNAVGSDQRRRILADMGENVASLNGRAAVLLRSVQNVTRKRVGSEQAPLSRSAAMTMTYTHIDIDSAPRVAEDLQFDLEEQSQHFGHFSTCHNSVCASASRLASTANAMQHFDARGVDHNYENLPASAPSANASGSRVHEQPSRLVTCASAASSHVHVDALTDSPPAQTGEDIRPQRILGRSCSSDQCRGHEFGRNEYLYLWRSAESSACSSHRPDHARSQLVATDATRLSSEMGSLVSTSSHDTSIGQPQPQQYQQQQRRHSRQEAAPAPKFTASVTRTACKPNGRPLLPDSETGVSLRSGRSVTGSGCSEDVDDVFSGSQSATNASRTDSRSRSDSSDSAILVFSINRDDALSSTSVSASVSANLRTRVQPEASLSSPAALMPLKATETDMVADTPWVQRSVSVDHVAVRNEHDYQNLPPLQKQPPEVAAGGPAPAPALALYENTASLRSAVEVVAVGVSGSEAQSATIMATGGEADSEHVEASSLPARNGEGRSESEALAGAVPRCRLLTQPTVTMRPRFGSEYRVPQLKPTLTRVDPACRPLFELGADEDPSLSHCSSAGASQPIPIAARRRDRPFESHSYVNMRQLSLTPPDGLDEPIRTLICANSGAGCLSRSAGSASGMAAARSGYMNLDFSVSRPPAELLDPNLNYADMRSNADGTLTIRPNPSTSNSQLSHTNSHSVSLGSRGQSPSNSVKRSFESVKRSATARLRGAFQPDSPVTAPRSISPRYSTPASSPAPPSGDLNYAELDFSNCLHSTSSSNANSVGNFGQTSATSASSTTLRISALRGEQTDYAQIDAVKTEALSRLAIEHPALRLSRFREQQATEYTQPAASSRRSVLAELTSAFRPRAPESTA